MCSPRGNVGRKPGDLAVPSGPSQHPGSREVISLGADSLSSSGSLPFVLILLFLSLVIVWRETHRSFNIFSVIGFYRGEKRERVAVTGRSRAQAEGGNPALGCSLTFVGRWQDAAVGVPQCSEMGVGVRSNSLPGVNVDTWVSPP